MFYLYCQLCKVWVEATKCPNNTSDKRVFVHEDNLPASTKWFAFDSVVDAATRNCWIINPNDDRHCLPQDAHVYRGYFPYAGCKACEIVEDEDDGDGAPGGGGPGGGGGGDDGPLGDGAWPFPGVDPKGVKVTVCDDHLPRAIAWGWPTDRLYIATDIVPHKGVYDIGGLCVQVPAGPVEDDPAGAFWIGLGNVRFDSCRDCTHGVEATLCGDDQDFEGADALQPIYIRTVDLPAAGTGFAYNSWCYKVNAGPSEVIPDDALLYLPLEDLPCISCNRGVQYEVCPDEEQPPTDFWARQEDIDALKDLHPELTEIFMKIEGYCHRLDLDLANQRIPLDARIVAPKCSYLTCAACLCSQAVSTYCPDNNGIPVHLCPREDGIGWRDTWLHETAIPVALTTFRHNGKCVFVDPRDVISKIPRHSEILYGIKNKVPNCAVCRGWRFPPDDPGPPGAPDPVPDPGPNPPGDPPDWCYFRLYECDCGWTDKWIFAPCDFRSGAGRLDGVCYAIKHPGKKKMPAGAEEVVLDDEKEQNLVTGETACNLYGTYDCGDLYHLRICDDALSFPDNVYKNVRGDKWAPLIGQVVQANGGTCYEVYEGDVIGKEYGCVEIEDTFADCETCEDANDPYSDEPCTDCDPTGAGADPENLVLSGATDDTGDYCAGPWEFAWSSTGTYTENADRCQWSWAGEDAGANSVYTFATAIIYAKADYSEDFGCGSFNLVEGKWYVVAELEDENAPVPFAFWDVEETTGFKCVKATGKLSGTHTFSAGPCDGDACSGNLTVTIDP